jgi:hypothetical protein
VFPCIHTEYNVFFQNTDGLFRKHAPLLHEKILSAVHAADNKHWQLFQGITDVTLRCIEFHTVKTGGALAEKVGFTLQV